MKLFRAVSFFAPCAPPKTARADTAKKHCKRSPEKPLCRQWNST